MSKKYRMTVRVVDGSEVTSIAHDDYPTHVNRLKEMSQLSIETLDAFGNPMVVIFNTKHIVWVLIREETGE